ncbi:MAG: hypothetical protein OSB58_07475 [Alphaproteobacteria bacterium]|jgi:hypothetical protein|nr:hypothetical protein [Alphaproteobacteria bacterium]
MCTITIIAALFGLAGVSLPVAWGFRRNPRPRAVAKAAPKKIPMG